MYKINVNSLANGKELNDDEVKLLSDMNNNFTHVLYASKSKITCVKPCRMHGESHIFLSVEEFANYTSDYLTIAGSNAGRAWFKWPGKNKKLDGVGFYPHEIKCPNNVFNTYIKPKIVPIQGDCSIYLNHLHKVICAGDSVAYEYLIKYIAHIIQKPHEKPSVAVVMKSVEGTGKGTMMNPLLKIFGAQGIHLNGDRHITGQFNGAVANKLLIFADEVNLTSTATADKLKSFISESTVQMEKKGLEAVAIPNYARVFFASNRHHVIAAGVKERRYLVLEPCPKLAQHKEYFEKLYSWIDSQGDAKLFHYFSNLNIEDFNPFCAPSTKALIDQKLQSLSFSHQFIYDNLLDKTGFAKEARIQATKLIERYLFWCENKNISIRPGSARSQIGKLMTQIVGSSIGRSDRGDGKYYELLDVEEMRENFAHLLNLQSQDIFE
ncbi:primase-helicase family protein [Colwelliaceae bacterium BS250]